jgi:hypothetical protein
MTTLEDARLLIQQIKAHIWKGDTATAKAENHYVAAGQYLKQLKEHHTGNWDEWEQLLREKVGIGKSRASELMQIADGRKTFEGSKSATKKRVAKHRAVSPLRNGEADILSASRAIVATEDDDAGDDEQTVWWRCELINRAQQVPEALRRGSGRLPVHRR